MSSHSNHSKHRVSSSVNRKVFSSSRIKSAIRRHSSCPVCLNRVGDYSAAVLTVCRHVYCIDCIRKWSRLKRNCPLCNAEFGSWFLRTRFSATGFKEERLPDPDDRKQKNRIDREGSSGERARFSCQRAVRRSIIELERVKRQSRPLPWRRSFGRLRHVSQHERQKHQEKVADRVLQWRASIYSQHLQAVPLPSKYCIEQKILANNDNKEKMRQRLEPWISRELQVILGDTDPSVIVHLCISVYMSVLEEKLKAPSNFLGIEEKFVEQLEPFLFEKTSTFWHELRCFARSVFDMTTYDSIAVYKQME